ncbi:MAG: hypothetical protein ABI811_22460 [Acidobacteriota bacterium]
MTQSQGSIQRGGHALREVTALRELPPGVQTALGVGALGLDGIADRGEKYNPTDVVDSSLPMRRFVVAGLDGDSALVAIEHGGLGREVEVALFSNASQNATAGRKWTLIEAPKALRDLVGSLPAP